MPFPTRKTYLLFTLPLTLALASCGDDAPGDNQEAAVSSTTEADAATTTQAPASGEVKVTAVDYAFEGLPASTQVGTKLSLTNASDKELHELVAIKLRDNETRTLGDLLKLPPAEQQALASGPPAMVLVAPPGGAPQITAVGDGTLNDPGRYLVVCTIPTGADPKAYMAAAAASRGGPVSVPGGPPHLTKGMSGEIVVK